MNLSPPPPEKSPKKASFSPSLSSYLLYTHARADAEYKRELPSQRKREKVRMANAERNLINLLYLGVCWPWRFKGLVLGGGRERSLRRNFASEVHKVVVASLVRRRQIVCLVRILLFHALSCLSHSRFYSGEGRKEGRKEERKKERRGLNMKKVGSG